ncbi:MAG: hypothetical protein ACJAS4_003177 [Bacteriovoracaceae bacterium]|jgi:hypothetical protein
MSKLFNLIFLCFALVSFTSCGDLLMQGEPKKEDYNQFATCEFDTEAITKIMTVNINGEILCLERNLNLFIDVVKGNDSKPGFLHLGDLKTYIRKNLPSVDEQTIEILGGIFDLNSLLFGDDKNYIEKINVNKLTKLLIEFNKIVVEGNIFEYFTTKEKINFFEHNKRKTIIYGSLLKISNLFDEEVIANDKQIDIANFLDKFENFDNKEFLTYVDALLFLKKAILGGNENTLTANQLKRLTDSLGDIGKVTFDFINLPDTNTLKTEEEEVFKILKEDLQTTYKLFYYKNSSTEKIVSYNQILKIAELFFPDMAKYVRYKGSFLKAKEILVGSDSEYFSALELSSFVTDFLQKNVSQGVFLYRSYMTNESVLEKSKKIWYSFINLITFNNEEEKFVDDFNRIAKDYRYFQGSKFAPLFDFEFRRNPKGMFDILMYEDLVKRTFAYYGSVDHTAKGDYIISQKQLAVFMVDFQELLEGEGFILPGRSKNTAETITLLTTLFHLQSNGDARIEIPEFVEFLITMTSSLKIAGEMQTYMLTRCTPDNRNRIDPACYRLHFLDFLNHKISSGEEIQEFVPQLSEYFSSFNSLREVDEYLISTAQFSRSCSTFDDGSEVPMKKGDFIVSWAGLLAVEQSMLKFDVDKSGILEPKEVDEAYKIYKSAVIALIPVNFLKRYSKTFFRYLVKYKRLPDVPDVDGFRSLWKALREGAHFVKFIFKKEINQISSADRMTFAAVLRIMAVNSPANRKSPYPCETLR